MVEEKKKMKSVILTAPGEFSFSADAKDIPVPGPNQVLIRVECAVINPTDTYYLAGQYKGEYSYPLVPGLEGSGTVIASGGGFYAWTLVGKRVSFTRILERSGKFTKDGTYAEYCVTDSNKCITLEDNVSFEQAASGVCNPMTALGLLEKVLDKKATAVIQTAANSQMGRMMNRLLRENGIQVINIVRKEEQAQALREKYGTPEQGCHVLNSEFGNFKDDLKKLAKKLNATVVLECISGPIVGVISSCLPEKSSIICYG